MKRIDVLRLLSLLGLGALVAGPCFAADDSYFYGGLSIGQSRAKIDEERITATLLDAGFVTTSMTRDEKDTAYKLLAGYQFNRYVGLEGGYFNLGKFGFTSNTSPAGSLSGQIKLQGFNLDVVGTLPLTERFSAIGRVGAQYAQARDTFSATGAVGVTTPSASKREVNYKLGIGLQYAFSSHVVARVEGERYRINDAVGNHGDINMISAGLIFPFGRTSAPVVAAAPAYVAPTPVPAPAPAPVPPPAVAPTPAPPAPVAIVPERRRVSFSADSLFAFDQWVVRPEGKAALDTFTTDLKGTQYVVINVEGHSDRLGSPPYNQKLSLKRADSVKDYLVTHGGLDANKISAVGKGESEPVTKATDCKGNKRNASLIACLQPDRRVEVEVVGTR